LEVGTGTPGWGGWVQLELGRKTMESRVRKTVEKRSEGRKWGLAETHPMTV